MGLSCCHHCRVRFNAAASQYLTACPECERPTAQVTASQELFGFRLFDPLDMTDLVTDGRQVSPAQPRPLGRLAQRAPASVQ